MTKAEYINGKIALLQNFCFLSTNDARIPVVVEILDQYNTRTQIDNALYNVVRFNETINEFIKRKGATL